MKTNMLPAATHGAANEPLPEPYGPHAGDWLIDGVLPLAGVAMLEAETLMTAALVADDFAVMLASGQDWGDRATTPGARAIVYRADGKGEFIEDSRNNAALPFLDMTREPHPEFIAGIKAVGGVDLLIVHVLEELADDAWYVPKIALSAMELTRDLNCCVLLATGPATVRPRDVLHAAADVTLYASRASRDFPGEIAQTKTPGDVRGRWLYTSESGEYFGEPDIWIVAKTWEAPRNVE